ncbi:MAG: hypothetical protein WCI88_06340 [Chloroflexota bacterium]
MRAWLAAFLFGITLIIIATACATINQAGYQTQTALDVQATMIAMQSGGAVQPTIARQGAAMTVQAMGIASLQAQSAAQSIELTRLNDIVTQIPPATPISPTTPLPTFTPAPPPPTPVPTVDFEAALKTARILLYEDMAGIYDTRRYVKKALDDMKLSYTDTADRQGEFKQYLTAQNQDSGNWDLIISANESRSTRAIKGEFFKYFENHLQRGAAVIIETWNLDSFYQDQSSNDLLKRCGIEYHGDIFDMRWAPEIFYSLVPGHPLLTSPNYVSLNYVSDYWNKHGDLGDMVKKLPVGGDAVLLLGRHPENLDRYGVLTSCFEGRMILQTFTTHQYRQDDIVQLWQNYFYNALKNRFIKNVS